MANKKIIETPIFLLFAEYLGYLSPFADKAEEWCDGKVPGEEIQKFLIREAQSIFKKMKEDYTIEEINNRYKMYYTLLLKEYDDKLKECTTRI